MFHNSDVKTGVFPKLVTGLQKLVFLPVIKRLLSTDYHGIGIRKGANLSAELEYAFFQN